MRVLCALLSLTAPSAADKLQATERRETRADSHQQHKHHHHLHDSDKEGRDQADSPPLGSHVGLSKGAEDSVAAIKAMKAVYLGDKNIPLYRHPGDKNASGVSGRAPSCGGCHRRESVLSKTMRLKTYSRVLQTIGPVKCIGATVLLLALAGVYMKTCVSRETIITLLYSFLYFVASPTAILVNKLLMKDYGFGYPVMVSAMGQLTTSVLTWLLFRSGIETVENGKNVTWSSLLLLGGSSALALVLGQVPYLYLTVAFIQMLKSFSPTYMVVLLSCLRIEYPSWRVITCVVGLSVFTCIASAGEVNFNLVGVLFMFGASLSDALRLVLAQKLLKNQKLKPLEGLYLTSPLCILWMVPAALVTEIPRAIRTNSFSLIALHPYMFLASGFSGFFVNVTSFLLVKRTGSMTVKTMTMARNGGLVVVSAVLMGEEITKLEALGYSGLLVCFMAYTCVKHGEGKAKAAAERAEKSPGLRSGTPYVKQDNYAAAVPTLPAPRPLAPAEVTLPRRADPAEEPPSACAPLSDVLKTPPHLKAHPSPGTRLRSASHDI